MGLCDQNLGHGGYGICYGLALQRAEMNFVVEVFSCEATEDREAVVVACGVCNVAERLRYRFCYGGNPLPAMVSSFL